MEFLRNIFLVFTFVAPLAFWLTSRWRKSNRFDEAVCRTLAIVLALTYLADLGIKLHDSESIARDALPMQLCDWVLFAVVLALWRGSQTGFELAYFWGLAGTIQALFTPAIDESAGSIRLFGFFLAHSVIVVGVFFLMLARNFRPTRSSLFRVVIWSEIFLATALTANALTGSNYGFLSARPPQRSMLDYFSDTHWLYVVQLNLCAFVLYAALYLPWLIFDFWTAKKNRPINTA
ncbi:MAG: TIGR02206 family membrane protein [Chthoniobacteraceae bacterium]